MLRLKTKIIIKAKLFISLSLHSFFTREQYMGYKEYKILNLLGS